MTDLVSALEESHQANERMAFRLKVMSWICVGLVAVATVLAVAVLFFAVATTALRSDSDSSKTILEVGQCRTKLDIQVDQIKDNPERTKLGLELLSTADPARKQEIADEFAKQSSKIKKLQDARLACGGE